MDRALELPDLEPAFELPDLEPGRELFFELTFRERDPALERAREPAAREPGAFEPTPEAILEEPALDVALLWEAPDAADEALLDAPE